MLDLKIYNLLSYLVAEKRYLLVDAYNVIHAVEDWHRVLTDEGADCARDHLAERVVSSHDAEGIQTVLVFDSRGESLEVDYPFGKKTFECVYAPAKLSADGVIERLVAGIPKPAHVTVASNDNMVRESARVNGAIAISAEDLLDWICASERHLIQDTERRRKANEKAWRHGIDFNF